MEASETEPRVDFDFLKPLIISAPFGNYVQPKGCTPTLGTFTAKARPGRVWRIVKTLRYYRRIGAWVNKIGLRNPGIEWLAHKVAQGKRDVAQQLVSIHGFEADEWSLLLQRCADLKVGGIELNMSCPNVGHINWPEQLFAEAVATGRPVVVKIPPVNFEQMVDSAYEQGVRAFHCCNTLPVPAGGVSGKPLMPVSLQCLGELKTRPWFDQVTLIGGGGINTTQDIDAYVAAGVQHVALGTKTMDPRLLVTDKPIRRLIQHAATVLGDV